MDANGPDIFTFISENYQIEFNELCIQFRAVMTMQSTFPQNLVTHFHSQFLNGITENGKFVSWIIRDDAVQIVIYFVSSLQKP